MLQRLRHARLLLPTVFALLGLSVLVGLGTWQLERKRWKEDLLAKIAARVNAVPVPVAETERRWRLGEDLEYLHVAATGRFHHDKERYLYAPAPAGLVWHVYAPLEMVDGRIVWVNRGAVPQARKDRASRQEGQLAGNQTVTGLLRVAPPSRARFAPANDSAANIWYWPELSAMTASAFPASTSGSGAPPALPFAIEADARPEPPGGLPRGGVTRVALSNRHLEYAVTWYGLALALLAVYLAFCFKRLKAPPRA